VCWVLAAVACAPDDADGVAVSTVTETVTVSATTLPVACFDDADGDGFGAGSLVRCDGHTVDNDADCDDADPLRGGGAEVPYTGRDEDCDPTTADDDLDDDGLPYAEDCDDTDALAGGGVEQPYDGRDNDCDPATADDDLDADGVAVASDCDDRDPAVGAQADDADCDGAPASVDCDDGSVELGSVDDDADCDGALADADCDDTDATIGALVDCDDRDSDGWADGDDCAPDDGAVFPGAEPRAFRDMACDGTTTQPVADVADTRWVLPDHLDELGGSVAVGDLDGDGLAELGFGADPDDANPEQGVAYVVYGHDRPTVPEAVPSSATVTIDQVPATAAQVALGGDVDGDGVGDLLVSGLGDLAGAELAVFPSTTPLAPGIHPFHSAPVQWVAPESALNDPRPLFVPDLDGDGHDEVVLASSFGWTSAQGVLYLLDGDSLMGVPEVATWSGPSSFGQVVATADLDGDGLTDLVVGGLRDDPGSNDPGAVFTFLGDTLASGLGGTEADADGEVVDVVSLSGFGEAVAVGDIDDDGLDDVLVGVPRASDGGQAALFFGGQLASGSLTIDDAEQTLSGGNDHDDVGELMDGPGDLDGDGVDDFVVGAEYLDGGEVFFVSGADLGGGALDLATRPSVHTDSWYDIDLGHGDVDGDGRTDLLLGHDAVSLFLSPWRAP